MKHEHTATIASLAIAGVFTAMMNSSSADTVQSPAAPVLPDPNCIILNQQLMTNALSVKNGNLFELSGELSAKFCQSFVPWEQEAKGFDYFGVDVKSMTGEWKPAYSSAEAKRLSLDL